MFAFFQSSPIARRQSRTSPKLSVLTFEDRWMPSTGSVIGSAANYGVLGLQSTAVADTNSSIDGSIGVAQGGSVTASGKAPSVTQNVYESSAGQVTGKLQVGGTIIVDSARMAQANSDAASGSVTAASQIATQTFFSINSPTTITGNGGINVINISGNIASSLILSGSANDVFIVNVTGNLNLKGKDSLGIIGVTADHVLYNFTGAGTVSIGGNSTVYGTFLAPMSAVKVSGVVNGAVIAGGSNLSLNGSVVHEIDFTGQLPNAGTASISGTVGDIGQPILDQFGNPVLDSNGNPEYVGLAGATVELLDSFGNVVKSSLPTDATGSYTISAIASGTYNLVVMTLDPITQLPFSVSIGSVTGQPNPDGHFGNSGEIDGITLAGGNVGSGYNFQIQIVSGGGT